MDNGLTETFGQSRFDGGRDPTDDVVGGGTRGLRGRRGGLLRGTVVGPTGVVRSE